MKMLNSFEQGSPEWKLARAGKVTASRAKDARDRLKSGAPSGKQIAYACQVALERVSGAPADMTFENWQMREGHVQEPIARAAYESRTGNLVDEVGHIAIADDCHDSFGAEQRLNLQQPIVVNEAIRRVKEKIVVGGKGAHLVH